MAAMSVVAGVHGARTTGHDTTVMRILAALGCWDGKRAPFASHVALELLVEEKSGGYSSGLCLTTTPCGCRLAVTTSNFPRRFRHSVRC